MRRRNSAAARFYGAVVAVHDLDRCRAFYEHVLALGQPVVDSNFWVEFEIVPDQMVLALKKVGLMDQHEQPERQNQCAGSVTWCLQVQDLAAIQTRLLHHECYPQAASILPNGMEALTFHDPEGNPFTILGPSGSLQ